MTLSLSYRGVIFIQNSLQYIPFFQDFQRCILAKLDTMIEKQDEALSILRMLLSATRGVGGNDILEDLLPNSVDSMADLEALSARLADEDFKKKMVRVFFFYYAKFKRW